jgi:LmbE family N-acetylglucosaminyl deacetylase
MRILGFEAHPDDMEHFYSGTLAKYSSLGHQVGTACFTNGDVGSPTLPMEEIARVREQELRNSAAIIDAEVFWMGYHDEFLFNSEEIRRHTIDIVRRARLSGISTSCLQSRTSKLHTRAAKKYPRSSAEKRDEINANSEKGEQAGN